MRVTSYLNKLELGSRFWLLNLAHLQFTVHAVNMFFSHCSAMIVKLCKPPNMYMAYSLEIVTCLGSGSSQSELCYSGNHMVSLLVHTI